jgi:hypothetical protein
MTQSNPGGESDLALRVGLLNLATTFRLSQALYVAARLGIADLLAGEPQSVDHLATATAAHAPSLARLLRTLVAFDLLHETAPGLYALAPMGV